MRCDSYTSCERLDSVAITPGQNHQSEHYQVYDGPWRGSRANHREELEYQLASEIVQHEQHKHKGNRAAISHQYEYTQQRDDQAGQPSKRPKCHDRLCGCGRVRVKWDPVGR
jgi:hypothetical protein